MAHMDFFPSIGINGFSVGSRVEYLQKSEANFITNKTK